MKIFAWRFAYFLVGALHFCGVTCLKVADRFDSILTDQFRQIK